MTLSLDLPPLDPEVSSLFGATVEAEPPAEGVAPGALLDGTVETVDENWVYVRLTDDAVGRCPLDEAAAPGVRATPEAGAQVRALVEADLGEGRWGVSIGKAVLLDLYGELRRIGRAKERVRGRINQVVRGGFAVDALGVRCFLPGRESGIPRDAAFDAIGHAFTFDVIRFDRRRGQPVLSRARVAKIQRERALEHAMATLEVGSVVSGTVTAIKPYGVFVDLGVCEGLCHVSELTLHHIDSAEEVVSVGDTLDVKILGVDGRRGRVSLSRRDLLATEKNARLAELGVSELMTGKVTRLVDFGAFVEIGEGIEGLLHVSELSWTERISHPSEVLEVGQELTVRVLGTDPSAGRVSLSLRQVEANPWNTFRDATPVGAVVKGEITRIEDYGLFVRIAEHVEGLCHISDLTWEGRPKRPSDVHPWKVGDEVEVKVLDVDAERGRVKLGHKQVSGDPWDDAGDKATKGTIFTGEVTRFDDRAAYIRVVEGLEARLHISQISTERVDSVRAAVRLGQEIEVMVTEADRGRRRLDVSVKAIQEKLEAETPKSYADEGTMNPMADLMRKSGLVGEADEAPQEASAEAEEPAPEVAEPAPEVAEPAAEAASEEPAAEPAAEAASEEAAPEEATPEASPEEA